MRLSTRQIEIAGITPNSDAAWVQQMGRNLTDWEDGFLRDSKYVLVDRVAKAIEKALRLRHCNRDIVAQYLYPDGPATPPTFRLDGREHLQGVTVSAPDLRAYRHLLGGPNG